MKTGSRSFAFESMFSRITGVILILFSCGCLSNSGPPQYQNRVIPESAHPVLVDADLSQGLEPAGHNRNLLPRQI